MPRQARDHPLSRLTSSSRRHHGRGDDARRRRDPRHRSRASSIARRRRVRDLRYGTRVTFSPKVFIPLTMLCRDRCGYCTFAKPPARLAAPYLSLDEVLAIARAGAEAGCHEALFTLGRASRAPLPAGGRRGSQTTASPRRSTTSAECCRLVTAETGLLAHANAGALRSRRARPAPRGGGQPGDDARVPQPRPGVPPRVARQDARPGAWPPWRRPASSPSPSRPASSSASARPGRTASSPCGRSPPATPATGTSKR